MKTAVVVLNYKGVDDTISCLRSLFSQTFQNFKLYLVENGSNDGSEKILREFFDSCEQAKGRVTLQVNQKNRGFTGGVNQGITWAIAGGFDLVCLLNNDTVCDSNWLKNLVNTYTEQNAILKDGAEKSESRLGAVTSLMLSEDGKTIDDAGDNYSTWGIPSLIGEHQAAKNAPESTFVFGGTGGATLYSCKLFEDIGLFDEAFFAYNEDVDIDWRAQLRGWKIYYERSAVVYHKHSATSSKMPGFTVYQVFKNLPQVLWKNVPFPMLIPLALRFTLVYILFFGFQLQKNGFIHGLLPAIRGSLRALSLFPRAMKLRRKIQRDKLVSNAYVKSVLQKGLPLRQVNRLKQALKFRKPEM